MSLDVSLYKVYDTPLYYEVKDNTLVTADPAARTEEKDTLFSFNITHNLAEMAIEAGLYSPMWRPEEVEGVETAGDLVPFLKLGIANLLKLDKEVIDRLSPENGWGTYKDLLGVAVDYLNACCKYSDAFIGAWR